MAVTEILHISAAILTCAAAFGWANIIWFRLPHTIAMVLFALALSVGLIGLDMVLGGHISYSVGDSIAKFDSIVPK